MSSERRRCGSPSRTFTTKSAPVRSLRRCSDSVRLQRHFHRPGEAAGMRARDPDPTLVVQCPL